MSDSLEIRWTRCRDFIRDNIGQTRFETWFGPTRALSYADNVLTLEVPTHFYFEKYEDEFYGVISAAVLKEFGRDAMINYSVRMIGQPKGEVTLPHSGKSKVVGSALDLAVSRPANPNVKADVKAAPEIDSQLNPALNFENYCVGGSNRLAYTIAESIAANPRNSDFNPFFLYGDVGVGKTHLIQAIGIRVKERNPRAKVLFTTLREFQHLYATAVINREVPNFIQWYMGMDVILFDDLQEIAHKQKTSEALFPIFNHLHQNGRQLVFTCDRPPMELDGIADRLIDRFKWGLTEKLPRPDAGLRKKILTFKARRNGLDLPEEVIDYVAANAVNSVREIEGIVMGILTRSINLNVPIDLKLAKEVTSHTVKTVVKKPLNFEMIVEATAEFFRLNPDVLFSKSRVRDVADARQVVMYLSSKLTQLSSAAIGRKLNRGHGTVLHGITAVKERLGISPEFANAVEAIEHDLV